MFAASMSTNVQAASALPGIKTVVVDAGHGGHDPGAVSAGVLEKDITLDVALKLGSKIKAAHPDINVIFTRDRDIYIPLNERSAIANRNKADLFISIHVNSVGGSSAVRGTETFIMGTDKSKSNMEVCKTENSVILLEDDYTTTYSGYDPDSPDSFIFFNLMQNAQFEQSILAASAFEESMQSGPIAHSRGIKQAPLLVLWRTTMPSVLVEIGFISSKCDRDILRQKASRDKVAECLFNGFERYRADYEHAAPTAAPAEPARTEATAEPAPARVADAALTVAAPAEEWAIQIFVLSSKLPEGSPKFKGLKCECVKEGGRYKYITGKYSSKAEATAAAPAVRKKFPGAFVVNASKLKY